MSRSPMSPAGKRLRTMNYTSDEDSDSPEDKTRSSVVNLEAPTESTSSSHQPQRDPEFRFNSRKGHNCNFGTDDSCWARLGYSEESYNAIKRMIKESDSSPRSTLVTNGHYKLARHLFDPNKKECTADTSDEDDDFEENDARGHVIIKVVTNHGYYYDIRQNNGRGIEEEEDEVNEDEEDYDEDEDEDEIDDDVEDRSEDYEDIEEYDELADRLNFFSDSEESSGYQDWNHVGQDYDNEDDSLGPDSEDEEDDYYHSLPDEYLKHDPTPDAPYPKPDWITINELRNRKYGFASTRQISKRPNMYWFEKYASNSLWMIQRLQLEKKLQGHSGSVNCIDFNKTGNLICSGSDDLTVCIWDWQASSSQPKVKIPVGHNSNVFQSKFCNSDKSIVTSSRDGTVRIVDIETNVSEILLASSGEIGQLSFVTPQTFVTCGTNAAVHHIDLRTRDSTKLLVVRNPKNNRTFALHSINVHPYDTHKIAVAGASQYVFLYDLRRLARETHDVEHKPTHCLGNSGNSNHIVTSTAFNSTGDKLLISYNDDDLYVCRTETCQTIHKYQGHRNKKTIKGCAWFGDNFVLSGSDDGHIYGWDLESEHIVCFLEGDNGVVNCLSVHPDLPVLASSGFDHDVKLWEPVSSTWPQTLKGIKPQICKNTMRRKRAQERRTRPPNAGDDGSDTDV